MSNLPLMTDGSNAALPGPRGVRGGCDRPLPRPPLPRRGKGTEQSVWLCGQPGISGTSGLRSCARRENTTRC